MFTGVQYPAMGNHECTGATASNCGAGARDGVTRNMTDFIQTMLQPLGISDPYYVEHVNASDGTWNAKFVVVACNAWNPTQAAWLTSALAEQTTLLIVGHTHTYRHYASDKEIIVGNGGAPLTTGMNYGYVIVSRQSNGNLVVTAKDYMTGAALDSFTITPSGSGA